MKRMLVVLSLLLLIGAGCSSNQTVNPDSPKNTAWLMKLAADNNDFAHFESLFSEGRKVAASQESFDQLRNLTSAGTSYASYELLTFENGEMVLVHLIPMEDGKIEIQDIIFVPKEMRELFAAGRTP
ncbi:hypothetical protein [Sutcliffiella halmapala]|uniref:hypothetical protein n=1 Tax=Sutcliffiella halmapala TaxID=79882 RepID=UPI0009958852|nr:hypothetical protein [Sutcliffiella halmapala]